ncbi:MULTISPECIES: GvpL/GvpF family gas vesicle protein [Halobacillus]|uniref:Gas vesicle protein GvpF n=1 Tax=Halobacillus trueperi TaxID=156205 RepID=A0A3D8VQH9_9BACI|nr:GvpL/GvpF family gas vesicle protein [Halobacillus trueperi]RDY71570.1 gas vesicle protein GvpF [Halobacillus trueperi]REJ10234.1 gas vesicle protein GvpF [Halobacillus trueperi]
MSEQMGIYVFCCIQTSEQKSFGTIEFEGEEKEVFTVHHKDAAMVAVEAPIKIYHPKKKALMTHQQVISRVMETESSVVPISFGNVFNTKEDTQVLIENLYPQLEKLFVEVRDKIEIGLKIVGKREWLEEQINQNDRVKKKKETVANKSEAAGYFDRIQLGEMARDFFTKIQKEIETTIHAPLDQLAEASQVNDTIGEKMLLNGAYLIDREKEEAFDKKVNELHERWKEYVDFKYTGPWPAYNFINIKLKVEAS